MYRNIIIIIIFVNESFENYKQKLLPMYTLQDFRATSDSQTKKYSTSYFLV